MVKLKDILGRAPGQPDAFGALDTVSRLGRLGADADPLRTINAHARQLENLSRADSAVQYWNMRTGPTIR